MKEIQICQRLVGDILHTYPNLTKYQLIQLISDEITQKNGSTKMMAKPSREKSLIEGSSQGIAKQKKCSLQHGTKQKSSNLPGDIKDRGANMQDDTNHRSVNPQNDTEKTKGNLQRCSDQRKNNLQDIPKSKVKEKKDRGKPGESKPGEMHLK